MKLNETLDEKPRYIMIVDTISHPSIYGPTADEGWQS